LSDALKRRCLHLHIPFPDQALERAIIRSRVPEAEERLQIQLVTFVQNLRQLDLKKVPAISETIDWARTLVLLHARELDRTLVETTLNVLLKFQDDVQRVNEGLTDLLSKATSATR
jgi:MoxR-like ATPase